MLELPDEQPDFIPAAMPLVDKLHEVTSNLYGYLEQRTRELAEPHIQVAEEAAAGRVATIEADLVREQDLVAELRRQITALERQLRTARERAT